MVRNILLVAFVCLFSMQSLFTTQRIVQAQQYEPLVPFIRFTSNIIDERQLKSYHRHFTKHQKIYNDVVMLRLGQNESLRKTFELTPSQSKAIESAHASFQNQYKQEYLAFTENRNQLTEEFGEKSPELTKNWKDWNNRVAAMFNHYKETCNESLVPYQQELLQKYSSVFLLKAMGMEGHEMFRPYLMADPIGLTDQEKRKVKEATITAMKELEDQTKATVFKSYEKIVADVPVDKRQSILKILKFDKKLSRERTFQPWVAIDFDSLIKKFEVQYKGIINTQKAVFVEMPDVQRQLKMTDAQIGKIFASFDLMDKEVSKEIAKVEAEMRIAVQKDQSKGEDYKSLFQQRSKIHAEYWQQKIEVVENTLLPQQVESLNNYCAVRALQKACKNELLLLWPQMLGVAFELNKDHLNSVKQASDEEREKLKETTGKIEEALTKKTFNSYPEAKKKQLEKLLDLVTLKEAMEETELKR